MGEGKNFKNRGGLDLRRIRITGATALAPSVQERAYHAWRMPPVLPVMIATFLSNSIPTFPSSPQVILLQLSAPHHHVMDFVRTVRVTQMTDIDVQIREWRPVGNADRTMHLH